MYTHNPLKSAFVELTNENARSFYAHQAINFALSIFSFSCQVYEAGQTARELYVAYLHFLSQLFAVPTVSVPRIIPSASESAVDYTENKPKPTAGMPVLLVPAEVKLLKVAATESAAEAPIKDLKSFTVKDLRAIAKSNGIVKTAKMTKTQLLSALEEVTNLQIA